MGLNGIMFPIVGIFVGLMFIFMITITFSPKVRAKFMEKQLKATKYMMDENENILREMSTKSADVSSEGIEIKARAIKKGFSKEIMFCKHCGKEIDIDSKFCNYCGKEQ